MPKDQYSGPITVAPLEASIEFEGARLQGVLEVNCLPDECRFNPPLLFDFRIEGGSTNDPIIDEYGRIGYKVRHGGAPESESTLMYALHPSKNPRRGTL